MINWSNWSPWHKMDPNASYTYSNTDAGIGAFYSFEGDPALIGVACSIVSDITGGKYKLLKWDKQESKYYPISINLYEKGEIDDN